jgi:hypothetical protein
MKNSKRVRTMLCAGAAAMALTATAEGATTPGAQIDQSSLSVADSFDGFVSQLHGFSASQTFTAAVSGPLTDVSVSILRDSFWGSTGSVRVAINPVDGLGDPNTAVELAVSNSSVSVASLSTATAWVYFAFATPADLHAGTTYAITMTQINGGHEHVYWAGSSGDTYAGGKASGVASGDLAFKAYMIAVSSAPLGRARAGYCSVAGNTWQDGTAILAGTFLNLADGQPAAGHYQGATSAYYLEGLGISCRVPAGFAATDESVGFYGHGDPGLYPYYRKIQ